MPLTINDIRRRHHGEFFDPNRLVVPGVHLVPDGGLFLTGLHPRGGGGSDVDRRYLVHRATVPHAAATAGAGAGTTASSSDQGPTEQAGEVAISTLTRSDGTDLVLAGAVAARKEARRLAEMLSQPDGEDRLRQYLTVIPIQQNVPPDDSERRWRCTVGIRYRAARRAAGLDLKELAELTGSSPGRLRALESGRSRDFLLHIRAALALSEDFDSLFANHPGQRVDGMWQMIW